MHSQISPHRAQRIDLPGRYGTIAALRAPAAGDDAMRTTALLVPGYTGSKEDFAPVIDPIADAGFEVVAIDLPGQQDSEGPDDEALYRPGPLGSVVAELIGKIAADGRKVLLLGHSYGGLVCRAAVFAGAPLAGLTLMSSGPAELPAGERRTALEVGEHVLAEQGVEGAQKLNELRASQNPAWAVLPQELKDFYRARFLKSPAAALLGMGNGLRHEPDQVAKLSRALRTSGIPCLVVCGDSDDAWTPAAQRDMAERLDADFAVLPGVMHSPNTEAPGELIATLLPTWRAWLAS
ncbi:Lysophospholipase, alpha-beta hydrolase superfamily [Lentzea xinjiangensis]|uniref:Lysophospholipase, alpha-beta hydrolase superfamily n=1 Tax=Lentzea xinjiangensis TaxID=402600 RepID=A0A1H9DF32_9PSEU|nr:alpha/beta hydrolase [Lentzea xinjiangensis]SEQ12086.1 Lysophospholipase, alpha-beta hydrolase superfamily [Lentzea xinjiangensis]